jgi:hypothetical protein
MVTVPFFDSSHRLSLANLYLPTNLAKPSTPILRDGIHLTKQGFKDIGHNNEGMKKAKKDHPKFVRILWKLGEPELDILPLLV